MPGIGADMVSQPFRNKLFSHFGKVTNSNIEGPVDLLLNIELEYLYNLDIRENKLKSYDIKRLVSCAIEFYKYGEHSKAKQVMHSCRKFIYDLPAKYRAKMLAGISYYYFSVDQPEKAIGLLYEALEYDYNTRNEPGNSFSWKSFNSSGGHTPVLRTIIYSFIDNGQGAHAGSLLKNNQLNEFLINRDLILSSSRNVDMKDRVIHLLEIKADIYHWSLSNAVEIIGFLLVPTRFTDKGFSFFRDEHIEFMINYLHDNTKDNLKHPFSLSIVEAFNLASNILLDIPHYTIEHSTPKYDQNKLKVITKSFLDKSLTLIEEEFDDEGQALLSTIDIGITYFKCGLISTANTLFQRTIDSIVKLISKPEDKNGNAKWIYNLANILKRINQLNVTSFNSILPKLISISKTHPVDIIEQSSLGLSRVSGEDSGYFEICVDICKSDKNLERTLVVIEYLEQCNNQYSPFGNKSGIPILCALIADAYLIIDDKANARMALSKIKVPYIHDFIDSYKSRRSKYSSTPTWQSFPVRKILSLQESVAIEVPGLADGPKTRAQYYRYYIEKYLATSEIKNALELMSNFSDLITISDIKHIIPIIHINNNDYEQLLSQKLLREIWERLSLKRDKPFKVYKVFDYHTLRHKDLSFVSPYGD